MLKVYENIKKRRIQLGMSQTVLAQKLGYADKTMISRIENGMVDLPLSKLEAFADALRVEPSVLMGWSENDIEPAEADSKRDEFLTIYNNLTADDRHQLAKIAKTYLPD